MPWIQVYDPLQSAWLSTIAAALPIVVLLGTLAFLEWRAYAAAAAGLATALVVAIAVFGMPVEAALASAGFGAAYGLLPIGWIVVSAVFLYNLTVRTGQFDVLRAAVARLSPDRRIQALLIAFSFGAFIEGAAGFGTPVAITAALMIGLGFKPLYAAGLALIANTAPVAFGAIGTPILTLAAVTGLPVRALSAMAGRQLPLMSLLIPAWLVVTMSGWRGLRGVWPAVLVSGGSFAVVQFAWSNFVGPELVDIVGGLVSLGALAGFCRLWRPSDDGADGHAHEGAAEGRAIAGITGAAGGAAAATAPTRAATVETRTPEDPVSHGATSSGSARRAAAAETRAPQGPVSRAMMPWVFLSVFVLAWGLPAVKSALAGGKSAGTAKSLMAPSLEVPGLHGLVYRDFPVEREPPDAALLADPAYRAKRAEAARFTINWISATGTAILLAAIASSLLLGVSLGTFATIGVSTLRQMTPSLVTISLMLALGFVTRYSGTDATLGLAFTKTGFMYPMFAALLGWLGVALTGSDTSSNVLFGSLQKITAQQLGLNPILITTANSTGGVMGKMIDAQSIVVATAATGQAGQEPKILRFVFWHSVVLAILMGLIVMAQAYLFPWMVPDASW